MNWFIENSDKYEITDYKFRDDGKLVLSTGKSQYTSGDEDDLYEEHAVGVGMALALLDGCILVLDSAYSGWSDDVDEEEELGEIDDPYVFIVRKRINPRVMEAINYITLEE